jgi:WD40 repeat protein
LSLVAALLSRYVVRLLHQAGKVGSLTLQINSDDILTVPYYSLQEHENIFQRLMRECVQRNGYITVGRKSVAQFHPKSLNGLILSRDVNNGVVEQLRLINVETGTLAKELRIGNMSLVELSPDGELLAGIAKDTTKMVIMDAEHGNIIYTGTGDVSDANCLKWSADSKYVACGSKNVVLIWRADTSGEAISSLQGYRKMVANIAWSPNSQLLASWDKESVLTIWDVAQKCVQIKWSIQEVSSIDWSPDGKYLVTGGRHLQIWDPKTGEQCMKPLEGHIGMISSVAWSPNSKYIASGGHDAAVHIWDTTTGMDTKFLKKMHSSFVMRVAWSADSESVVSSSYDETIRVWKIHGQKYSIPPSTDNIRSLVASPCAKYVLSGSKEGKVRVWDIATCTEAMPAFNCEGGIELVAWSPIGEYIAIVNQLGTVHVWDVTTAKEALWPLSMPPLPLSSVYSYWEDFEIEQMVWSPNGRYIAVKVERGTYTRIQIWNLATGEGQGFIRHEGEIHNIVWSSDSGNIAGDCITDIRVWDIFWGQLVVEPLSKNRLSWGNVTPRIADLAGSVLADNGKSQTDFIVESSGIFLSIYLPLQTNKHSLLAKCKAPAKLAMTIVICSDCICAATISPDWSPEDPQFIVSSYSDEVCAPR